MALIDFRRHHVTCAHKLLPLPAGRRRRPIMAALGRLSGAVLRSALTQSRRQLSASAAEHGEDSGKRGASVQLAGRFQCHELGENL